MKNRILGKSSLVRYVVAGSLSYIIELSFLLVLHMFFSFSVGFATAVAFWVGLAVSFVLQKLFAFQDYQKTIKATTKQIGIFLVLILFNYLFTLGFVMLSPSRLIIFSRTLALTITTVWNYVFYKKIIFRKHTTPNKSVHVSTGTNIAFMTKVKISFWKKHIVYILLLSLPVVAFFYQYLSTGNNKTLVGDFDYYSQLYEALRISILKFHQFPLWNPWMSGGIPLFANPQFGLFSLQSLLTLIFGAVYGLKLAYIVYALLGFWGMYCVGRNILEASKIRSALVSYVWVFSGFFAGHNINHFTFTSFFLLPWLLYFIVRRYQKYSWLWLGIIVSAIILSSIHYAFLMISLTFGIYFVLSLAKVRFNKSSLRFSWELTRGDLVFALKTGATVLVLAGYRFYITYSFEGNNQRLITAFSEGHNSPLLIFKALFLPIGTLFHLPKTLWGWGEYSMYVGIGTGLAFFLCLVVFGYNLVMRKGKKLINNRYLMFGILVIGVFGLILAPGDIGNFSPFHVLHILPGFTQTRVPSRWLIMTVFALLVFLMGWQQNKKTINILLALSTVELFLSYGPPRFTGTNQYTLPPAKFSNTFTQYDNGHNHLDSAQNTMHSYFYTTSKNVGQIYADDSLINTMSGFTPLPTSRCAQNINPSCDFVLTHNAVVSFWSPNKIILYRTNDGPIELNMNVETGWRINGIYAFAAIKKLDPTIRFVLPNNTGNYTIENAPKLSPSWLKWRLQKIVDD